jgi:predicted nucleic acid-binding protein
VSALVLDAGALLAVDRDDRAMMARLRIAQTSGLDLRTTGAVVAQVWRDPGGRQANLARLLRAVDVIPVDDRLGREAGVLLGRAGAGDAVDATVAAIAAIAARGDRVLTSDPDDMARLVGASGRAVGVVRC